MDLAHWPTGTDARVLAVDVDATARLRVGELGLRPGAVVRVTHRAAFGGRVVAIGAQRFAVDAATCARVRVSDLAGGDAA
ncbi:FeoA family protein [Cellulomonas sp. ES6]|uniref:FeoA family protein n=1 Tax=Cellulomonas sp. ES6 TaxID=3039384 RepID=UPI0019C9B2D0|nr:FeoA family protein [Cellulomonas sp. ES6]MBD3778560.1 ferrous iron transport protein A [Micrococcales bacterium]WHP16944.1 FeoA family protein [Cellulomonas sp. ES6]